MEPFISMVRYLVYPGLVISLLLLYPRGSDKIGVRTSQQLATSGIKDITT